MVYTVNKETKARGLRLISIYLFLIALVMWFPLRKLLCVWLPDKVFFVATLIICGIGLCTLVSSIIVHILRARSMSVIEAKRYLVAFAHQYDTSVNTDIANAVSAILVLEQAGVLKHMPTDNKRYGVVSVDTDNTNTSVTNKTAISDNVISRKATVRQDNAVKQSVTSNLTESKGQTVVQENIEVYTLDDIDTTETNENVVNSINNGNKMRTAKKKQA